MYLYMFIRLWVCKIFVYCIVGTFDVRQPGKKWTEVYQICLVSKLIVSHFCLSYSIAYSSTIFFSFFFHFHYPFFRVKRNK